MYGVPNIKLLKYRHAENRSAAGCRSGILSADRHRQAGNFCRSAKGICCDYCLCWQYFTATFENDPHDAKGVYYAKDFLTYVTKEMLEQNTSVPADTQVRM